MGTELFHKEGQMDRQTDMMQLIVSFTVGVSYTCHRECRNGMEKFAQ
jgi:hypothetical protein